MHPDEWFLHLYFWLVPQYAEPFLSQFPVFENVNLRIADVLHNNSHRDIATFHFDIHHRILGSTHMLPLLFSLYFSYI